MTKRVTARLALVLVVALSNTIANAALPPKYQRLREFEAVLASQAVTGAFPDSEVIQAIEHVSPDRYRVRSAKCRLDVTLKDLPMRDGMVGPRQFSVKPGRIICAQK